MKPVVNLAWDAGYRFRAFRVDTTKIDFRYSRRAARENLDGCKGSNISAVWTLRHQEALINGVLQGRKQTDPLGASALSRIRLWNLVMETIDLIKVPAPGSAIRISSHLDLRRSHYLEQREQVKKDVRTEALKGWTNGNFEGLLDSGIQS